ncbi:hypothetical protein [Primorskyibacter sp. 2E233]|uniref:hypothetical protein n=1 Tax=Primorskyibacter sp. 2E233 TaxID=3413431 RepID=UPI003BF4058B
MSVELQKRLEALEAELAKATAKERADLLAHLEEAVLGLEAKGETAPAWAKAHLATWDDEEGVEEQFDNMPL